MIGIFGGTFNPVHDGHLMLAEQIREEFGLSGVVFMPAYMPPHKANERILPAAHRVAMLRLAIEDNPWFSLDELELARSGYSYTADSLRELLRTRQEPLAMIVGADSAVQMHLWKDPQRIFDQAELLVARRPDTDGTQLAEACARLKDAYGARIQISSSIQMPHSSTEIRDRAAAGRTVRYLVPDSVHRYLLANRLYLGGDAG